MDSPPLASRCTHTCNLPLHCPHIHAYQAGFIAGPLSAAQIPLGLGLPSLGCFWIYGFLGDPAAKFSLKGTPSGSHHHTCWMLLPACCTARALGFHTLTYPVQPSGVDLLGQEWLLCSIFACSTLGAQHISNNLLLLDAYPAQTGHLHLRSQLHMIQIGMEASPTDPSQRNTSLDLLSPSPEQGPGSLTGCTFLPHQ